MIEMAEKNWQKLGVTNVKVVEGNIDDTLYIYNRKKPIDFGYIDANHTYEATLRYFEALAQRKHEKTIIALDDIHYNEEMERAWKEIGERSDVTSTMDFYGFGLVFFDTHYLKRHYRLRI
ncbi:MAG: class I SAM-dependent methyltransferase [Paludibacteraceae bacterium]|nr:class I SAM-dependent methyltransferase [Paludibacteraceae bacterium]